MIGASGKRILIFEINEPTAMLGLGLTRPGEVDESEWEAKDGLNETLDDHLFVKTIGFTAAPLSDDELDIFQ